MRTLPVPVTLRKSRPLVSWGRSWRGLVGWALVAAVVSIWFVYLRPERLGGRVSYLIVSGHSMEPTLHTGDLVVALRERSYRRGAVIAYHIPKNEAGAGRLVIHRIVGGSVRAGYMTQGDNRDYRDPWRPKPKDIAGEMRLHAPRLGLIPVYAHTLFGMAVIAALVGFFVLRTGADGHGRRSRGATDG